MDEILVEREENGVVTLTINRPRVKNAIKGDMWEELRRIFHEVTQSESDRVLIITGAGGDFCAGADLAGDMAASGHLLNFMHSVNAAARALHEMPKPTIAKVRGVAVGAGMNLALGCDLIVASEDARFSEIFVRRALSVDFGGTWLLPRLVGLHKAKELALLGDVISAEEAERIAIVNRVLPDAALDDFVSEWAERLAAGPPLAMQMTKRMLADSMSTSLSEALSSEAASQTVNFGSEDTAEGLRSFIEKRSPVYRGR